MTTSHPSAMPASGGGSSQPALVRLVGAETVMIAGFTTDQCVRRTFRTALASGYDARVVAELTATFSRRLQRRTERSFGDRLLPVGRALELAR